MPLYDYECACGCPITLNRKISERDDPIEEKCKECHQNKFKRKQSAPMIVSGVAGRMKTTESFNDRLKEVRKNVSRHGSEPLNNIIRGS